jgi:hypothetical protein
MKKKPAKKPIVVIKKSLKKKVDSGLTPDKAKRRGK